MSQLILVLGGARSGKSSFAEQIVEKYGGVDVTYIATAEARDEEMADRIKQHQSSRPEEWTTIEEPQAVSSVLGKIEQETVVLLDCVTVLVSNLLLADEELDEDEYEFAAQQREEEIMTELEKIIAQVEEKDLTLVVVSNEVGQGLVPSYQAGRIYRDVVGRANQFLAAKADEVYITYAGLPVEIKELGQATRAQFETAGGKTDD
ncbi:bifunctional adenosylcobinamide kinase/adenosylcobinamide-phosphate guanylyltransferase [Halanaerobacter jeridensis]|uniref:Adenosylcobinamide kinase n=1 Tax=Halanaerobacter jeridensis TaxID=706427 RepID=A0A938XWV2_9FIRM|nr:bifunctional adenosylcobinamide kinase/adenosylcobinamide-phosphate guanylyltransferase [Halanaerobacter jeridensis]MBM7557117.1 adenosylcobinamide kinase/adenosylcobinamide-phosphate guanylyltransferase [Halanaerobacter jeridensis]